MRSGFASLAIAATLIGCLPELHPLPPRRTQFSQPEARAAPPTPDLAVPTEAPVVHERYAGIVLASDLISLIPLTYWMFNQRDSYLALPALVLAPAIHVAYGSNDSAAISILMRAAMVSAVYFAGRSAREECDDELICLPFGSILLAELAVVPVVVLDSLLLAKRSKPKDGWSRLPVQPSIMTGPEGQRGLSLMGRF